MSQIYKPLTSTGPIPPIIPTQFTTDVTPPAIPSGNNLNVLGGTSVTDNANGIQTRANPAGSANLLVELTNRQVGTGGTSGAGTLDLITFSAAGPARAYKIKVEIVGNSTTAPTPAAAGITLLGTFISDGATITIVNIQDKIIDMSAAIAGTADANFVISGTDIIVRVTGSADIVGRQIQWFGLLEYIRVA